MNLGFFFSLKISKYFVNGVHKNCERRSQNCERRSQFQVVNGSARHPFRPAFFETVFNNFFPGRDIEEILFGGHSSRKKKILHRSRILNQAVISRLFAVLPEDIYTEIMYI